MTRRLFHQRWPACGLSLLALVLAVLSILLTPALALAHAYPVRSDPAPNATVAQAPSKVQIWFSERLEPKLSNVSVYDSQKREVQAAPSKVDPADPTFLTVALRPNLPAGTYTVVWHVVSADDGHSTAGVFAFGVGVAAQAPAISPATLGVEQGQEATPVGVIGRWLVYLGSILVLGIAVFALGTNGARPTVRPILIALALAFLLMGQVLRLADETMLASGGPLIPAIEQGKLAVVLIGSRFGTLWLLRSGLVALGAILVGGRTIGTWHVTARWFWSGCLVVGLGLIVNLVWSGHAAAGSLLAYASLIQVTLGWASRSDLYLPAAAALVGAARTLTLIVDGLHLTAVSVWIGGVIALASFPAEDVRADVARFSRIATGGLIVVVLTGLYNTWLYLAGPVSFVTTGYGQSLLLKHASIVALLVMAASNQFVTVPLLTARKKPTDFPRLIQRLVAGHPLRTVRLEAGLGVVVLLTTGLLTSLGPARTPRQVLLDPARELSLASAPFQTTLALDAGQRVQLTINPGRTGPNDYKVVVTRDGEPAEGIQRAYLELTPLDLASTATAVIDLRPAGPGRFTAHGLELSTSGTWQAKVSVYRVDGSIGTARMTFQSTGTWAATVDPRARALLGRAEVAMARLRSARMVESLGDGAGGLNLTEYSFAGPDREKIVSPNGGAVIQIGTTIYTRERGSGTWKVERGVTTYPWPDDQFGYLHQGVGGIVVGERSLLGHDCVVVAFYAPGSEAIYEEWIGKQDHRIYQEVMAAPAHYMVNQYQEFDGAVEIERPVGLDPLTTETQRGHRVHRDYYEFFSQRPLCVLCASVVNGSPVLHSKFG